MPENNDNGMPENTGVDGSVAPEKEENGTFEGSSTDELAKILKEIEEIKKAQPIYVPPKETEKDTLEGKKSSKPDTGSWEEAKIALRDVVHSRGGGEGAKAYPIERKGFFEEDEKERTRIIKQTITPTKIESIDEIVAKMVDPFNERESIFDIGGFFKTKDENNNRIRGIYKGKDDTEPRIHEKDTTASNIIFFASMGAEELDLTPVYVDMKAFEKLIEEVGEAEAMQITLGDATKLGQYKNKIRNELKAERKDRIHERIIEKKIKDYVWERLGLEPNEEFSDEDNEIVLKVSIEGQVNKEMRDFRLREKAAARINHKYKVKRLYTAETTGGRDVGIMIKYETPELHKFKGRVGGLEGLIEKIALPVSEFLSGLHTRWKMKHRDMKPSNIFLDKKGFAVVADFGLAKKKDEAASDLTVGKIFGSPGFMAPEQARGEDTDETCDIYSFGRTIESMYKKDTTYVGSGDEVLFALRSGKKPFAMSHRNYKYLKYEGLGVDKWYSRLNPFKLWKMLKRHNMVRDFETVTSWLCQLDKEKRPKSCDVVYQDYKSVLEGKKPENVENYMKANKIKSRKDLIEGAYETGKELVSEEARLAKESTHSLYKKYILPAVAIVSVVAGVVIGKGCENKSKTAVSAIPQYEQRVANK